MSTVSTHVLDTALGRPANGVRITLALVSGADGGVVIATATTNAEGRVREMLPAGERLGEGTYRLTFAVDEYFARTGREAFYPEVVVLFRIGPRSEHYHVPLLLSPFGYATYRGS